VPILAKMRLALSPASLPVNAMQKLTYKKHDSTFLVGKEIL
jgi:hypothetical protein